MQKYERWLGPALLAATWLIFFSRVLSSKFVYFLDDLKIFYYPLEHVYAQSQAAWQLPLWSNYFGFGQPLLGWGQLGFFTPVHILLRALQLHPLNILQISIVVYFAIGLTGMHFFLRRNNLSQAASTIGAITFTFSGFFIGHLNHVNFYTGTLLLPWLLLAVQWLVSHPTLSRSITLSTVCSIIALSAQPQIVLYTLLIGALYGLVLVAPLITRKEFPRVLKITWSTALAGFLFLGLASFAILPLLEFLPFSDRAGGVDPLALFEFSYPPSHAITLIFPYFFGDHDSYWGAKGFQELAGYTGLLPLLLASVSLLSPSLWKKKNNDLIMFSTILLASSIALMLGKYSPIYTWLVEENIVSALAVPGRFVYFFNVGIALLAAIGLQQINSETAPKTILKATTLPVLFIAPFLIQLRQAPRMLHTAQSITQDQSLETTLTVIAVITFGILLLNKAWSKWLAVSITSLTLIVFGWNYNPMTTRAAAFTPSPFAADISATKHARLYSRPGDFVGLPTIGTNPIGPNLSFSQPIPSEHGLTCLSIPFVVNDEELGTVLATLTTAPLNETHLRSISITATDAKLTSPYRWCFESLPKEQEQIYLNLTSNQSTSIGVQANPEPDEDKHAFLIRVNTPTQDQIARSRKPYSLDLKLSNTGAQDTEADLIARHLNVTHNTSSAQWAGALSVRSYREFINAFFANDNDNPIDGDGQHALQRNRALVDFVGITHILGTRERPAEEPISVTNFEAVSSHEIVGATAELYANQTVYPKARLVPNANTIHVNDETRHAIQQNSFDPSKLVYINGPTPPDPSLLNTNYSGVNSKTTLTKYTPTHIEVTTSSPHPAWLVMNDTTLPQWHTFVDGQPAPYYVANTTFKAAHVPAGEHHVSFQYQSSAIEKSRIFTLYALLACLLLILWDNRTKLLTSPKK